MNYFEVPLISIAFPLLAGFKLRKIFDDVELPHFNGGLRHRKSETDSDGPEKIRKNERPFRTRFYHFWLKN